MHWVRLSAAAGLATLLLGACCPGASDPPPAPLRPGTVVGFPDAPEWIDVNTYRVVWDPANDNGSPIHNYAVYALTCNGEFTGQRALTHSGATTIDFGPATEDNGNALEPGTSYKFAVRARNEVGGWDAGGWNTNVLSPCTELDPLGNSVDATPPPEPVEVGIPSTVTSFEELPTRVSPDTIRVSWKTPEDVGGSAVDYEVYAFLCDGTFLQQTARTGSGATTIDFGPVVEKSGNGLAVGDRYKFTVRVRTTAGWDNGSWITNVYSECSAPDPG